MHLPERLAVVLTFIKVQSRGPTWTCLNVAVKDTGRTAFKHSSATQLLC